MKARQALKRKIRDVLSRGGFAREQIRLIDGDDSCLHLYVVSPSFRGKRLREKGEMIWPILFGVLSPDEWGQITLVVGLTPEELNGKKDKLEHIPY